MSAETMKMPDPIIEPITIVVESRSPSRLTNPASALPSATVLMCDPHPFLRPFADRRFRGFVRVQIANHGSRPYPGPPHFRRILPRYAADRYHRQFRQGV